MSEPNSSQDPFRLVLDGRRSRSILAGAGYVLAAEQRVTCHSIIAVLQACGYSSQQILQDLWDLDFSRLMNPARRAR